MLAWYDSPEMTWYQRKDKPRQRWSARQREHRYNLLRAVLRSAEKEGLVDKAPAIDIRRRKRADRLKTLELPTVDALKVMESAMPDRLRAAVTLAAWTGLRFGELASLRRRDIDTEGMVVRVRRSVTRLSDGERRRHAEMVDPKTASGTRDVDIPPHVMPGIEAHLRDHVGLGLNALLFPGATNSEVPISEETLRYHWHKARKVAGYDELRWHDLRHLFGVLDMEATLAVGGTPADTQAHMGHADAKSTARYLHAVKSRGKLAAAMKSEIALRSVADEQA
jgi:integrase